MAPPTRTISPARSTTIAGARRSPGATRSTRTRTDKKASGPDGNGGLVKVPGDWREMQGTMWAHDHRFFFTAENVYKGNLMHGELLQRPRSRQRDSSTTASICGCRAASSCDWGNIDFDVNLIISDGATDRDGQILLRHLHHRRLPRRPAARQLRLCAVLRGAAAQVSLPHPQRLHVALLQAGAQLRTAAPVPFKFIANDGNFVVNPITLTELDEQGIAERYDIVVDFSQFPVGDQALPGQPAAMRDDGRGPTEALSLARSAGRRSGRSRSSAPIMEFRVVELGAERRCTGRDADRANSCGAQRQEPGAGRC